MSVCVLVVCAVGFVGNVVSLDEATGPLMMAGVGNTTSTATRQDECSHANDWQREMHVDDLHGFLRNSSSQSMYKHASNCTGVKLNTRLKTTTDQKN